MRKYSVEKSYRDLNAWKYAFELVTLVYKTTEGFPSTETYRLTSQMCSAAISITANIAEGSCRGTDKDFCRFLYMARGSAAELENYILLCEQLGYVDALQKDHLMALAQNVGKTINGLIKYLSS